MLMFRYRNLLSVMAIGLSILAGCCQQEEKATLYVGTYGNSIHILEYDAATGTLVRKDSIPATNSSYIAFGQSQDILYAVSEGDSLTSGLYTFKETAEGWTQMKFFNGTGEGPCYVFTVPGESKVVTADYSKGSFTVIGTNEGIADTTLQQTGFESRYNGNPPTPKRQELAHIHQIQELPSEICALAGVEGRYLLVTDLGNDNIKVARLNDEFPYMELVDTIECGAGSGPRHLEFNLKAGLMYCLTEISGEVLVWSVGNNEGVPSFKEIQRVKVDACDAKGSGDIHLHPSGKWLYTSHRLEGDGISVLEVGPDGLVSKVGFRATGTHPRNFIFSPDAKRMLVACRDTHSIEIYDIDDATGLLSEKKSEIFIGEDKPVCLLFSGM